ncbi:hypothetical protein NC796_15035 [Aliifodinibius sp. S!AR15-10]|uniref:hypothetical protein n=1 Tax=Aliifodinibius sp. S!AR15-10 TaxID=2950437 RepID=UPI00285C159A|nr:hypothetical protein [Aliifodinibius sp. S!AR15-10]MDR8392467.1 hypothetical protein [Aliifodinibius sp. S!AR15-10]
MHFSFSTKLFVGLLCVLTLVSCKDNSTDSELSTAVGLWKLNSTENDISYINVTETSVTTYDYMGDEYDQGEDCYLIEVEDILEINGNIYTFTDPFDDSKTIDVEVTVNGNTLTVKQPVASGTVTFEYTKHNGNTSSFTPECTDEEQLAKTGFTTFE